MVVTLQSTSKFACVLLVLIVSDSAEFLLKNSNSNKCLKHETLRHWSLDFELLCELQREYVLQKPWGTNHCRFSEPLFVHSILGKRTVRLRYCRHVPHFLAMLILMDISNIERVDITPGDKTLGDKTLRDITLRDKTLRDIALRGFVACS